MFNFWVNFTLKIFFLILFLFFCTLNIILWWCWCWQCVCVCLYFKVSYQYDFMYDCLKLGISHLAACSELNGSCVLLHQSHYSTCCECECSLAFYGSIISALKKSMKSITQHDKSSVLNFNIFSSFLPFSLPSPTSGYLLLTK